MMRYLLFDSACNVCTILAQEIERIAGGWLEIRSLRDPAMHTLLKQARPLWAHKPMLVEVEHQQVRVSDGLVMALRLLKGLGLVKSLKVLRLVTSQSTNTAQLNPSRRQFLLGGVAMALLPAFGQRRQTAKPSAKWVISAEYVSDAAVAAYTQEFAERVPTANIPLAENPKVEEAVVTQRLLASNTMEIVVHVPVAAKGFVLYHVPLDETGRRTAESGTFLYYEYVNGDPQAGASLVYRSDGGATMQSCGCPDPEYESCDPCTTNPSSRQYTQRSCCTCPILTCGPVYFYGPCGMC